MHQVSPDPNLCRFGWVWTRTGRCSLRHLRRNSKPRRLKERSEIGLLFLNRFFSLTEGNPFSLVNQFHQGHPSTKPNRTESSVQCAKISLNRWVQFEANNQFKLRFGAGRSHKPRTNRTEPKGTLVGVNQAPNLLFREGKCKFAT